MGPPDADGRAHLTVVAPTLRTLRLLCTLFSVYAEHARPDSGDRDGDSSGAGDSDAEDDVAPFNWLRGIEASGHVIQVVPMAASCCRMASHVSIEACSTDMLHSLTL